MSVDISVSITEDIVDIIATPTVNIVNVTNSASIDPGLYDLSEFTNTSVNPFVRTSGLSSYVPTSRTLTINGTTQDLSADRTFTISTGITIGTTAITSGTVGRVLFQGTGNVVQESANLFWDNTNGIFNVVGRINAKSTTAQPSSLIVEGTTGVNSGNAGFVVRTGTGYQAAFFAADSLAGQGIAGLGIFTGGTTPFSLQTGAPNGAFFIHNNGNIGIGTNYTNAGFKFDVNGTARVNGSSFFATTSGTLAVGTTTIVNMNYGEVPKTYLTGGTFINGTLQLPTTLRAIATGGGIQFAQQSAPSPNSNLFFGNDSTGVYYGNYGTLGVRFLVGSTAQMTLASTTGNVLINTTTDAGFRLDVNGTARFSGGVTGIVGSQTSVSFGVNGLANGMYNPGGNSLGFSTNSAARIYLDASNMNVAVPLCVSGSVATNPNASAQLDVTSTTRGFLPPRQTQAQRTAIASPAVGLIVYQTDLTEGLYIYKSTGWTFIV